MKSVLIFLFSFLLMSSVFSQKTLNRVDQNGRKQGIWIKKDSNERKIYEGQFLDDHPTGTFRYYYPQGGIKAVSVFSEQGTRTKTITYFSSGKKMSEGVYINEKRDSIWRFYSEYDGVLVAEESYSKGIKEGISKTYYAGKGIAELFTWKSGVREGIWEQYYTEGALKIRGTYKNDQRDGEFKTYYSSGKLLYLGQYSKGDPVGTWSYFAEKGNIEKKETYLNGFLFKTDSIKPGK